MVVRRFTFFLVLTLLGAPAAVHAQSFDTLYEYGNAASANATSGAGIARGATYNSAANQYTITAGGTDFWDVSDHGSAIFDSTASPVTGNFSAIVQVSIGLPGETMPDEWGRAGMMARTNPSAANSAYFAATQKFDGAVDNVARRQHILQFRDAEGAGTSRVSDGSATTLVTGPTASANGGSAVPVWLGIHRYGDQIFSTWAPDNGGAPGTWSAAEGKLGSADQLGAVQLGLFHQNHGVQPQTSTATFNGFSAGGFNNSYGNFPLTLTTDVALGADNKLVGSLSGTEIGGDAAEAVSWKVEILGDAVINSGLFARSYLRGNSGGNFDPDALPVHSSGVIPNISWFGNANPAPAGFDKYPDVFALPADTNSPGDNQDNYSVDASGQIFIPEPGVYQFKDGVDDYTYLSIGGDVLIDDNNWTGPSGSDNGGSPIVSKTFTESGWYDFTFRMAEGGGGDSGTLFWDYNNAGFPGSQAVAATTDALVPPDSFRHISYPVIAELSGMSVVDGVLMDDQGNMLTAAPGTLARLTVNGASQLVTLVPEPATLSLGLLGVLSILHYGRRRQR
jgi:hypothetical protein